MSGTTSVNLSDVTVTLEAAGNGEHSLVLTTPSGVLRIKDTVANLRAAAQRGLGLPIPAQPFSTATPAAAPADANEARFARIEEALTSLNAIAQQAQRRGLI